jgi:voltage-dependent anion channel protein 2
MAPPEFNDIGKTAKDILSGKDVDLNKTKFVYKATTTSGAEVTASVEKGKEGALLAEVKSKLDHKDSGLVITDTLKSDNSISAKIEAPKIRDGLKLDAEFSFDSEKSKETKFGLSYKANSVTLTSNYNVFVKPKFTGDVVFETHGLLVGAQASYEINNQSLVEYKAAVGYSEKDFDFTVLAESKLTKFTVGYSHKVSRDVTIASQATWTNNGNLGTSFAAKYNLQSGGVLLNKYTSAGIVSFGYSRKIHPDVKLSLGIELNTNPNENAHKYGFGLTFEPK